MVSSISCRALAAVALVCVTATASAQDVQQLLKDVWVATPASPREVDFATSALASIPLDPANVGSYGSIKAMAFEPPQLGNAGAGRSLIFVDGILLKRLSGGLITTYYADAGKQTAPAPDLSAINTVAVADDGTVLFSGYSRRKRVYELWAYKQGGAADLVSTGTPQLTDAVYLSQEDVAAAGLSGASGLLAATAKAIMYFPEPTGGWVSAGNTNNPPPLADATLLGLKGSTSLLSVDLVRGTRVLMLATSDRKLLTTYTQGTAVKTPLLTFDASVFKPPSCATKTPLLLVRNAGGSDETSVVSDSCGQVLPYTFAVTGTSTDPIVTPDTVDPAPIPSGSLVPGLAAIAVGEGNVVACSVEDLEDGCALTSGATTKIDSSTPEEFLVLQYELCDPRVVGCAQTGSLVTGSNVLILNSLLPQQIQDVLADDGVSITVPPYMFGAGPGGKFGALIVQTDDPFEALQATMYLEIDDLLGFKLGSHSAPSEYGPNALGPFIRGAAGTTPLELLNEDIIAYSPDNDLLPTVASYPPAGAYGFEATPVTVASVNPLIGGLRGFSVVMYGLQHDVSNYPSKRPARAVTGGIASPADLVGGVTPACELHVGSQHFLPVSGDPARFYINLVACLLVDQETLLNSATVSGGPLDGAFQFSADRDAVIARLGNVKDKLIKALNATGPNTGSTDFQAVITQLDNYRDAVRTSRFNSDKKIYQNELLVRADAFEFLLIERAYPSMPIGGFPPP